MADGKLVVAALALVVSLSFSMISVAVSVLAYLRSSPDKETERKQREAMHALASALLLL